MQFLSLFLVFAVVDVVGKGQQWGGLGGVSAVKLLLGLRNQLVGHLPALVNAQQAGVCRFPAGEILACCLPQLLCRLRDVQDVVNHLPPPPPSPSVTPAECSNCHHHTQLE